MKAPGHSLLLVSGLLKVGGALLILLLLAKTGWDLASGRQVEIPPILLIAIGATLAAQLATWAAWRYATRRDTEDAGA